MEISKSAISGTLESCDVMIQVEPRQSGLEIEIDSIVLNRFGEHILEVVKETLRHLQVERACVRVDDRGALDCTIRARLQSALYRASEGEGEIPWEAMIWPDSID